MSKYYTALVSNEGLDAIRSDFKVLIKADSIAQARAGAASRILTVERATDQEIFEAGRNGNVVLNLSDAPTDGVHPDQQHLPAFEAVESGGEAKEADQTVHFTAHNLVGATKSGSAPGWLQDAVSQATGD